MSDVYATFAHSAPGRTLIRRLGLPDPPHLRRHRPGDPLLPGPAALGAAPGGRFAADGLRDILAAAGVKVLDPGADGADRPAALIFDGTGIADSTALRTAYDFFHPLIRTVAAGGRILVLGNPPEDCREPHAATAQRALEGFVRSLGKEVGRGATAQLVYAAPGTAAAELESTVRFLLSGRSAYVSGQVIRVVPAQVPPMDWQRPSAGRIALVTGAARGIGAAVAEVLARDGAQVVALDVPAAGDALSAVANRIGGTAYQLDLTTPRAPAALAAHVAERYGRLDVVVHNAGITRDKTLGRMAPAAWDAVLDVNLSAPERINDALLAADLVPAGGRLIGVASIAGIAGNRGQTNYAASKAGVIGLVTSTAPALAGRGITVNAVAPGFIETAMTARMPVFVREAGRRLNSLAQGGLPADVAEAVAWLAAPASAGVTGQVVRVCGQSLLGA
ncbi:MAG TPA: 3-oxoacyl-ACP reductase [Pilimelia sp.]|nr:3-oxoacyl-ACP reductase [Pilimelia sp.]